MKGTDRSSDSMKRHSFIHATSTHSLSNHSVQGIHDTHCGKPANNIPSYAPVHQQKQ